jgi:chain length determinant protein EpsF
MTLNQLRTILWGRRWLLVITLLVVVVVTAIVTFRTPKMYVATASLIISFEDIVPYESLNTQVQLSNSYMVTQVNIVHSRKVALQVVDKLKLAEDARLRETFMLATDGQGAIEDWLADWLLSRLTVNPSRASRIVDVYFAAADPDFAARVANAFAEAYIKTKIEMAVGPARETTAWLSEQLNPLRAKVEAGHTALTSYQQNNNIIATDERLDIETARLQTLSEQLLAAQTDLQDAENREKQLEDLKTSGRSLETLPEIAGNSFIQNVKAEMLRKENELAELASELGKKHPQYQRAQAEVANLRRKLNNEIAVFTRGIRDKAELARERERSAAESLAAQKQRVLELKRQHDDISVLIREVDSAQRAYDDALTRFDQANMESRVTQTNALLFNSATAPLKPATPKVKQNLIIAVFAGTLLGLGLALVVENRDRRVRSKQDLAQELGVPMLATLGEA